MGVGIEICQTTRQPTLEVAGTPVRSLRSNTELTAGCLLVEELGVAGVPVVDLACQPVTYLVTGPGDQR